MIIRIDCGNLKSGYLNTFSMNYHDHKQCIDACLQCAAACNHCASSCLQEEDPGMMARCIQLDMECAAICEAAARLMSLGSDKAKEICRLCAEICERCAAECEKHEHTHCRECAELCRDCAEECNAM